MQTRLNYLVLISICILGITLQGIHADSLWSQRRGDIYSIQKKRIKVGDIITIYISETTSAVQSATTRTNKDASIGANFGNNWDQINNVLGNRTKRETYNLDMGGNDAFQGTGQTSRTSQVKAVVTATITEILKSGNLYIVGEHHVKVNNEVETIRISGIIRPQDITAKNSVFSYQIAKAEVSVNGAGVVTSKQNPGVLTKMVNWVF